jgi:primosomal protein N' (replication factor Y)
VEVPLPTLFDYRVPPGMALLPGVRVRVPFGRGRRCAVVVRVGGEPAVAAARLKAVSEVLDERPLLDPAHLAFLQWAADYYHHYPGEVIAAALPVRLRRGDPALPAGESGWELTPAGRVADPADLGRAPRQAAILAALREHGGRLARRELAALQDPSPSALRALRERGWLQPCSVAAEVAAAPAAAAQGPELSAEQAAAVAAVEAALGRFAAFLLEGVTGSGKTEVYLQLTSRVLARGENVLVLVPEISLTPQLVRRFERRLGSAVAVLHSGLSEGEREQAWQQARSGAARVVIGTRSAVLGPVAQLGLILVDEEHDGSFKQQDGFRYSARDLAVVRGQRVAGGRGCPVVLGSATPSLESLRNARDGRYQLLHLKQRAGGARLPQLDLLDIRAQPLQAGLSPVLLRELETTLAAGDQALVFLNRRGFAPVLTCYACGWLSDCPRCDARQTLHAGSRLLWCHHCGAQRRVPEVCPECGSGELHPLGQGTERLEQVLRARFPDYPLLRIDRDATRRKGSLERLLREARSGAAALLVGTQMLAKGHHFPRVTLVGVLDIDGGLFGADFRAAERMAQLVLQVAGRAGRGEAPGRVLIQTRFPEHPLLQTLVRQGYPAFAEAALAERREAELPPYSHQALLRAEAAQAEPPNRFLAEVAELAAARPSAEVALWGPVPAPMERRAGRYRAHLLLQAATRRPLHELLTRLLPGVRELPSARRVRWSLDVDPVDLL